MAQDSQNYSPLPPDFTAWIRLILQNFSNSLNCHTIGTIESFNPLTQTATIAINYVRVFYNTNPNLPNEATAGQITNTYTNYPLLINCPVVVMQGGGAYLTFPIVKGDTCLVLFSDREISTWVSTGQITYPQNQRTHDLSDAIALVGIRNILNAIPNYNTTGASLSDTTGERLNVTGDVKASFQVASHSGWLLMDGVSTIGGTGSGATYAGNQYQSLFTLLGGSWGSGTVTLPQGEGNTLAGYKSGDPYFGVLGGTTGAETYTLVDGNLPSDLFYGNERGSVPGGTGYANALVQGIAGSSSPFSIIQPTLVINWFIKI